jgi:hypothetical protein
MPGAFKRLTASSRQSMRRPHRIGIDPNGLPLQTRDTVLLFAASSLLPAVLAAVLISYLLAQMKQTWRDQRHTHSP